VIDPHARIRVADQRGQHDQHEVFRDAQDRAGAGIPESAPQDRDDEHRAGVKHQHLRQLEDAQKSLEKSDEYEVLSIKSDIAKSSLKKALENLADLKRNADIVPPTITIMGD
jgi:hypothetical protein